MTDKLQLRIGALAPKLYEQLWAQGLKAPPHELKRLQRAVDHILELKLLGLLTDGERRRAEQRLVNRVAGLAVRLER